MASLMGQLVEMTGGGWHVAWVHRSDPRHGPPYVIACCTNTWYKLSQSKE